VRWTLFLTDVGLNAAVDAFQYRYQKLLKQTSVSSAFGFREDKPANVFHLRIITQAKLLRWYQPVLGR